MIVKNQQEETSDKLSRFSKLTDLIANLRMSTITRFYRFASLAFCLLLLAFYPENLLQPLFRLGWAVVLPITAVMMVFLYERCWKNINVMFALILAELFGISFLLATTGGFHGPFLWYALNPFIVSTAFFPFAMAWPFLGFLLAITFSWKTALYSSTITTMEILSNNFYPALNLVVIVMIMHLFARMHMTMSEQFTERKSQQRELLSAYRDLSANYQVFQGLSNFQREVVAYKNQRDIYTALINTLTAIFPFRQAAVLIPPPDFYTAQNGNAHSFQVIDVQGDQRGGADLPVIEELEDRWDEFSRPGRKKMIIGRSRQWLALPLHGEKDAIIAIFVGWIKPGINPLSFSENLTLFIRFAEQTTAWLSMFNQKERVLQHVYSIYEAVETVSGPNNPRTVIDLFASYAQTLTDSDRTILWMINTGSDEADEFYPIYTEKGKGEILPEDDWQAMLLQTWSDICDQQMPVSLDLHAEKGARLRLIGVPVKSGKLCSGMLAGIYSKNTYNIEEIIQILSLLAELSAIAVDRARAEKFAEKLLIVEEQKRIAGEIHDTISQNLFSIVYSIDALSREACCFADERIHDGLQDIKNLSAETARDLRALIYRLYPQKEEEDAFVEEVKSYLDKLARMNAVEIRHVVKGSAKYLDPETCRAFYRIIKESTANSLRHSKCSEIVVQMDINPRRSILKISDNGAGFNVDSSLDLYAPGNRLGIVNMRELALSLQGNLYIKSKPGRGTEVTCSIPTTPVAVQ